MQPPFSRRAFLHGLAALPFASRLAHAAEIMELTVLTRVIEVNGRAAKVFGIQNGAGGTGLSVLLDKQFQVRLHNGLADDTLVHWHGLKPPAAGACRRLMAWATSATSAASRGRRFHSATVSVVLPSSASPA